MLHEAARAKVNLDLFVTGRRADGYHLLDSLVVFTELADGLTFHLADRLSLSVEGPFGGALPADDGNLVLRAARGLAAACGVRTGAAVQLHKRLPVAAGLGGGSADAGAALRGLIRLWQLTPNPAVLAALAAALGADVPVCQFGRPARLLGRGERFDPAPAFPELSLVLLNPGLPLSTAAVFAERRDGEAGARAQPLPAGWPTPAALAADLARGRNDLEPAARRLAPVIGLALDAIAAQPGCLLTRMSGSGATCFGLFATDAAATAAARALGRGHPAWWVQATTAGCPSAPALPGLVQQG